MAIDEARQQRVALEVDEFRRIALQLHRLVLRSHEGDLAVLDREGLDVGRVLGRHGEDVAIEVDRVRLAARRIGKAGEGEEQGSDQ